ncbi:unnamed protein product [Polarella glacialis]|nr:unnamed protein product [Polarella glacialis]
MLDRDLENLLYGDIVPPPRSMPATGFSPPRPSAAPSARPPEDGAGSARESARDGSGSAPLTQLRIEDFLGNWRDSMGNDVRVDWSRGGATSRGQLDVELSKPRGGRDPIRLNVKLSGGRFSCGHYDLQVEQSHLRRIVWFDCRNKGKNSTWER